MIPRLLLTLAVLALFAGAGCTGPGVGPQPGDTVDLSYAIADSNGTVLRSVVTTSFVYGTEHSGLGTPVDDALRGHRTNETVTITLPAYGERVEIARALAPIEGNQSASRADFTTYVGEPTLGKTFQAYGIYTGVVSGFDNDTVFFHVVAQDGLETPVPTVGATLVTHVVRGNLTRTLDPVVGATFAIQPPSPFNPSTPLGLPAGSYKVLGATDASLQYGRSISPDPDLTGKDLTVQVTITRIGHAVAPIPTSGNFGVRSSPQVKGDPSSVLGPAGTATSTT
jgi:hypothetical protein